ncbi:hypothetical protein RND71_033801 [Anisodus tanguticus]|uniref:Uncharacterized protein n=1 Tax=Anisodus tanguticus TaxID=243964 RepID=A0AAE1RBJ3_9SOLA|nr:hypothetical protein RND71_033801 [Anisodus tanguticus]
MQREWCNDVTIKILYCGICHTDLHYAKNDWGITMYPVVPGHEITGIVVEVGSNVTNFKTGDKVGVGCMSASCLQCESCKNSEENYCDKVQFTYNGVFWDGSITYGGYSKMLVADYRKPRAAPLLCAGVTVFCPMKDNNLIGSRRKNIGVIGLGGLGHLGTKFAKAFGHHVTVISTSLFKEKRGADDFIVSSNAQQMQAEDLGLHFGHSLSKALSWAYLELLKVKGAFVIVGAPDKPMGLPAFPLIFGKRTVKGSMIGNIKETQEMLDICGKYNIMCDIQIVTPDRINEAYERIEKNDIIAL